VGNHAGDTGSFDQLALPHFASLYNFACWLTQDRVAAEDLVQETFLKALKGFSSYQQGSNFRAWIFKILRNAFLTTQAGLKATTELSLDSDEFLYEPVASAGREAGPATREAQTPETIFQARADQETIQRALEDLPVHFREVILLCDLEEMSYQEISMTLEIPQGTVMSRLFRARKALRGLLAGPLASSADATAEVRNERPA
jgi:RNA polymerase sigma-70 factor (ECF subfamily)